MIKPLIMCCLMASSASVCAAQIATLEDGRQVVLKRDFTWHYLSTDTSQDAAQSAEQTTAISSTAATPTRLASPVIPHTMVQATIDTTSNTPLMELTRSDIDVVLGAPRYQNGHLYIPTALTNQGQQSAIQVTIQWQLLDTHAHPVKTGTQVIWQSIKRLGSTYLRPATSQAGKSLKIEVAAGHYHSIQAQISDIEQR